MLDEQYLPPDTTARSLQHPVDSQCIHLLCQGKTIRRLGWDVRQQIRVSKNGHIICCDFDYGLCPVNGPIEWRPSIHDLLALDWEVVLSK
jgi:hypothetical protein